MFEAVHLKTKIHIGFFLLAFLLISVGFIGLRGIVQLSDKLQFIVGPAWSTADGAMETSIEIEAQMLHVASILEGHATSQERNVLAEAQQSAEEALARLSGAGLLESETVDKVIQSYSTYLKDMKQLLASFEKYGQDLQAYQSASDQLVQLGVKMEEIGDGAVESIENTPTANYQWNGGLRELWEAADGAMETNIGLLWQLYYVEKLLKAGPNSALEKHLSEAQKFQHEAAQSMLATGRFEHTAGAEYGNKSFHQAYLDLVAQHQHLTKTLLGSHGHFLLLSNSYADTAQKLLRALAEVEAKGDEQVEAQVELIDEQSGQAQWLMKAALLLGIAFSVIGALLLSRIILGAIRQFQDRVDDIASGHGDLTRRFEFTRRDEFGELANSFDQFLNKIHTLVSDVASSSRQMQVSSRSLSHAVSQSSIGLDNQSKQTSVIATALHELSSTAADVSSNVEQASAQAAQAAHATDQIIQVLQSAVGTINRLAEQISDSAQVIATLNESANTISGVLSVIKSIAEQTNLLALNAAIEAARAGEQGRGFAVVADEVRDLAAKTQGSTEEIHSMIQNLQSAAHKAVQEMQESRSISDETTGKAKEALTMLGEVGESIRSLSTMNQAIAAAAEEQSATTHSVSQNVTSIQAIAKQTEELMKMTNDASNSLQKVTGELNGHVGQFKI